MAENDSSRAVPPMGLPGQAQPPMQQHMQQFQAFTAGQQYAQQFAQHYAAQNQQPNVQSDQLRSFWQQQLTEIENVPADPTEFKNHQLPLARIKKACEMFILELTLRSWNHAEENKRRTLQRSDVAAAITRTDIFDFLVDIVPREEIKQEGEGMTVPVPGSGMSVPVPTSRPPQAPTMPTPMGGPGGQMYYQYPPQGMDPSAMGLRPPNMPNMPIDPLIFQQPQYLNNMPGQLWPGAQQMQQMAQAGAPDAAQQQQQQQMQQVKQQQQQQQQ